jgi:F-type H+-transporting ATPase subunit epsilon
MLFKLTVITPKGIVFDNDVEELSIKSVEGYLGILAGHEPYIFSLDYAPGFIKMDGKKRHYAIFGGVLKIKKSGVTLITSDFQKPEEIDVERAKKAEERARERLKTLVDTSDIKRAKLALCRALLRLTVASLERENKNL